jgi:hypothetical protein
MKKRGQFSNEYVLLMGIVVFLVIISVTLYFNLKAPLEDSVVLTNAKDVVDSISQTGAEVYALSNTQEVLTVRIPERTDKLVFSDKEIYLSVKTGDEEFVDVSTISRFSYVGKTYLNPPEGNFKLLIGTVEKVDGLKICVVEFGEEFACVEGEEVQL